jgi:hypothetical protein
VARESVWKYSKLSCLLLFVGATALAVGQPAASAAGRAANWVKSTPRSGVVTQYVTYVSGHYGLSDALGPHETGWKIKYLAPPKGFEPRRDGMKLLREMGFPMPMGTAGERLSWHRMISQWKSTLVPHFTLGVPGLPLPSRTSEMARGAKRPLGSDPYADCSWTGYVAEAPGYSGPTYQDCTEDNHPQNSSGSSYFDAAGANLDVPKVDGSHTCSSSSNAPVVGAWTGLGGYNTFKDSAGNYGEALIQSGVMWNNYSVACDVWAPFFEVRSSFADAPYSGCSNGANPPVPFTAEMTQGFPISNGDEIVSTTSYTANANPDDDAAWFYMDDETTGQIQTIELVGTTTPSPADQYPQCAYAGPISDFYDGSSSDTIVEPTGGTFSTTGEFDWTYVTYDTTSPQSQHYLIHASNKVQLTWGESSIPALICEMSTLSSADGSSYSVSGTNC